MFLAILLWACYNEPTDDSLTANRVCETSVITAQYGVVVALFLHV